MKMLTLLMYFGIPSRKFSARDWQERPSRRKYYVKHIIDSDMAIGKTKDEILELFGFDRKVYVNGVWSYEIPNTSILQAPRFLTFYFNEDGRVEKVRIRVRQRAKS